MNGRVSVTTRALERTVAAIAAARLGAPIADVSIRLTDDAGLLAVAVTGPLTAPPLRAPSETRGMRTRVDTLRDGIREDVEAIAGSRVGRVSVKVSRAIISEERRVA